MNDVAVINTAVRIPRVTEVSPAQLAKMVAPGDVVLTKSHHPGWISKLIEWAQKRMLKKFGVAPDVVKILAKYTHALTITNETNLQGIEAAFKGIAYCYLSVDYPDAELLILRHMHELTPDEYRTLRNAADEWDGTEYDLLQYVIYPFYMYRGRVPWFWDALWNDKDKVVCSGLSLRLLQATGRLISILDVEAYPPARLPTIPAMVIKMRVKLKPQAQAYVHATPKRKPWWMR